MILWCGAVVLDTFASLTVFDRSIS